jgi:hypothetical protein
MSIPVIFNNRQITEPGVYSRVTSGEPNKVVNAPFGAVTIIDTGNFKGWGGGSGINGELAKGASAIYKFENLPDLRNFVKGGILYNLADYLFNPLENTNGTAMVSLVRACTTTSATLSKTFVNGKLTLKAKNEGAVSNTLLDEVLSKVAFNLVAADLTIGNTLNLKIRDGLSILETVDFVVSSTSQIANSALVVSALNASTAGFKAKLVGTTIVVSAPEGLGILADSYTLDFSGGDVTLGGDTTFQGGLNGSKLLKGLAMKVRNGDADPAKFIFEFHLGQFKGKTDSGFYFGDSDEKSSKPMLIEISDEFSTVDELIEWIKNSSELKKVVHVDLENTYVSINAENGILKPADKQADYFKFLGGTEVYNASDLDTTLEYLRESSNTYFLSDKSGSEAISIANQKILTSIQVDSEYERFLIIGGGKDDTEFDTTPNSSIEVAKYYDSEKVILVHGGATLLSPVRNFPEKFSALATTFNVTGRLAGLAPQEPLTFKGLRIKNFNHVLSINERTAALKYGVLHVREIEGMGVVVNQGINTLQRNSVLWNTDGKSSEISIMNISAQLNKKLVLNLRPLFIGGNRGRVTEADVKTNMESLLLSETSEDNVSKLIIKFKNVAVTRVDDQFNISYGFEPNGPINKMFITGFMLDNIN